jgi:hypothetical protein
VYCKCILWQSCLFHSRPAFYGPCAFIRVVPTHFAHFFVLHFQVPSNGQTKKIPVDDWASPQSKKTGPSSLSSAPISRNHPRGDQQVAPVMCPSCSGFSHFLKKLLANPQQRKGAVSYLIVQSQTLKHQLLPFFDPASQPLALAFKTPKEETVSLGEPCLLPVLVLAQCWVFCSVSSTTRTNLASCSSAQDTSPYTPPFSICLGQFRKQAAQAPST